MKTIKKISCQICKICVVNKYKIYLLIIFLFTKGLIIAQGGAHPGVDPTSGPGMNAPLDGGLITAILGLAGLATAFFKKRKDVK